MTAPSVAPRLRPIEQILELARWAPSGDNTQPWRFEIVDDSSVVVHGSDTRSHCVYDLDGRPSQLAIGAMLETASIAASAQCLRMEVVRRPEAPETRPCFHLRFVPDATLRVDALLDSITVRSVQRRAMSTRRLKPAEKSALQDAAPPGYRIVWLEDTASKLRAARLMFDNAKLRLTLPEAYPTHRDVIEWNARFSEDRVPDQALGVDPLTARLMNWVMASWGRVDFFNRYLAGTWAPRLQMDLIPALACGAHFLIVAAERPRSIDDHVAAGRAVQRVWLTATQLRLGMQPEMTPLIFARYVKDDLSFSVLPRMRERAGRLARDLAALVGDDRAANSVFMARIGESAVAGSRSLRRPLQSLYTSRQER